MPMQIVILNDVPQDVSVNNYGGFDDFVDQVSDPSNPPSGTHRFYSKSGGLFVKDNSGNLVGPLGAGGGGGTGSATTLAQLTDVAILNLNDSDSIRYSATDSKWHNVPFGNGQYRTFESFGGRQLLASPTPTAASQLAAWSSAHSFLQSNPGSFIMFGYGVYPNMPQMDIPYFCGIVGQSMMGTILRADPSVTSHFVTAHKSTDAGVNDPNGQGIFLLEVYLDCSKMNPSALSSAGYRIQYLSTVSTGSTTTSIIGATGVAWTVNEWAGASITFTSAPNNGLIRTIASNTSNTLTLSTALASTPASGNTFTINNGAFDGIYLEPNPLWADGASDPDPFPGDINSHSYIENVFVDRAPQDGMGSAGRGEHKWINVQSYGSGRDGFLMPVDSTIVGLEAGLSGRYGFFGSSSPCRAIGCKSFYSGNVQGGSLGDGFHVEGIGQGAIILDGCEAQDNKGNGFSIVSSTGNVIISGCNADSNSTGTAGLFSALSISGSNGVIADLVASDRKANGTSSTQTNCLLLKSNSNGNIIKMKHLGVNGSVVSSPINPGTDWATCLNNDIVINGQNGIQKPAFSATFTPLPYNGRIIEMTLTGNITTLNVPSNLESHPGLEVEYIFIQDATGSRTISFASGYKTIYTPNPSASAYSIVKFRFDGVNWIQTTGSLPWQFASGFPSPVSGDTSTSLYINASTNVIAFRAKRVGGTGATVDLQKNGISMLTTPLSLSGTTWTTASLVASPTLAVNDTVQVVVTGIVGAVTEVSASLEGLRSSF